MAKDGTARGGARPNSGPGKKALMDRILEGTAKGAPVLDVSPMENINPAELVAVDLDGVDMPPVKDYLKAEQMDGRKFYAEEVYQETYAWLHHCNCAHLVNPQLVTNYAMSVARWISVENLISEKGYIAKHPTTGGATASPYVGMSRDYMKQINACWYQINQIVLENCSVAYGGPSPQDDLMEKLLNSRG